MTAATACLAVAGDAMLGRAVAETLVCRRVRGGHGATAPARREVLRDPASRAENR